LTYLLCGGSWLKNLDLSQNTLLLLVDCGFSRLSTIDVSKNIALVSLSLEKNGLSYLDVSQNKFLGGLYCGNNNLISLNISDNIHLINLSIVDMPSLNKVCVWTMPFPPSGLSLNMSGSPSVVFTNDCSQ
jgi:hypothetical protein